MRRWVSDGIFDFGISISDFAILDRRKCAP
jgi:hypothetical protein